MQGIHEEISSPRRKNKTQQQSISKMNYLVTPTKKKINLEQTNTSKICRINRSVLCVVNDYGKLGNEK